MFTGGIEDGLVGEITEAATGELMRAAPESGSSLAASALIFEVEARMLVFTLRGTLPLYSGLLSVLVGPAADEMLVIGLRPEMVVYLSESGAFSVDGFISFGLSTNG